MRAASRLRQGGALLDAPRLLDRLLPDAAASARPLAVLGALLLAVNLVPAAALFLYLEVLDPSSSQVPDPGRARLVVALVLLGWLAVSVALSGRWSVRDLQPVADWLPTDRAPSAPVRRAVLLAPVRTARHALVGWIGAAGVFGVTTVALGYGPSRTVVVVAAIALAGVSAACLDALLTERVLRPVRARVLQGQLPAQVRGIGVERRMLFSWAFGSAVPLVGVVAAPIDQGHRTLAEFRLPLTVLCGAALVTGLVIIAGAARAVAEPLAAMTDALRRIEAGDLDVQVAVDDTGEVGRVQAAINEMVAGLRQRRRLEDLFGRYVGAEVAAHALEHGVDLAGSRVEASVVFVDLVGSTALASALPPEEVVRMLNVFFAAVVGAVADEGGWVNKFEGDGALCVFGPPADVPDHAARALRAALAIARRLADATAAHARLDAAIGVSSGTVVAGNIGSPERLEYTVIGDPVNEAARLTDEAKAHPARLLASAATVERAGGSAGTWVSAGQVTLRGRPAATELRVPVPAPVPA
ncbi:MAG TPA: adenylate/guanylate cyclase domain-containing protein [Acidimicrobiales bacterium]|nr:adenylate/guanylate cyclase domain-containing protein [Acidimicrobiales bacterium]